MSVPFDPVEAERLAADALALSAELLDEDREIGNLDAARRAAYRAEKRAAERSRRLAEYHSKMLDLWKYLADAQERGDMEMVRAAADAIVRAAEEEFRRREGAPP